MNERECPYCKTMNPQDVTVCTHCGRTILIKLNTDTSKPLWANILAGIIVLALFMGFIRTCIFSPHSSQDSYCYDQGVKFGRCAMMAFKGLKCDPSDDIVIPSECRGKAETERGIREGGQSVMR
jgi:hypothetical protein